MVVVGVVAIFTYLLNAVKQVKQTVQQTLAEWYFATLCTPVSTKSKQNVFAVTLKIANKLPSKLAGSCNN